MNERPKCIWTGNDDPRVIPVKLKVSDRSSVPKEKTYYVLPEYEQELREYNNSFVNNSGLFLKLIIGFILLTPFIALTAIIFPDSGSIILSLVGIVTGLLGVLLILFPFSTPETVKWLGLKRAIFLCRITGVLTILAGIAFIVFLV